MTVHELRSYLGAFVRVKLTNGEMLQGRLVDLGDREAGLYSVRPDPPHSGISTAPPDIHAENVAGIEVLTRV